MAKLSIIIPSRDERFLIPTIDDIFRNARSDDTEVIAVLDSDKWPEGWKEVADRHPRLHTIHNGKSIGMRGSINKGVGSAISRGAKFIAKFDGHCSFSEGFDEVLKAECEPNWVVVPRRGRLDPENWCETELQKPPIDYHYLSFPDDPNDFGGPGLNGKVWAERAVERKDILLDEEMSSQGSGWFMHAAYFTELDLMDEANYGPFWNEFQEIGLKCWLSGGKVMVNKKCKYLHLHKGKKYGRGYHLPESWLQQGRSHANLWAFNEAWPKQTLPFSWLIEHFWPVPSWPENWEEVLYATRKPRMVAATASANGIVDTIRGLPSGNAAAGGSGDLLETPNSMSLIIHKAHYGIGSLEDIDVRERLQSLVRDNSLDIIVNNSTLTPSQNPFRGKKKQLNMIYSIDGGDQVTLKREEKDWLIIGPVTPRPAMKLPARSLEAVEAPVIAPPTSPASPAAALNDFLRRRFKIDDRRLRVPMPIELRDFHRDDLAKLFAELKFTRGAEIGVAEGHYSETVLKANPEAELWLVDPWTRYSGNPRAHSQEHQDYSLSETKRKTAGYNVHIVQDYSMNAVRDIPENSLDWVYIDGHHGFSYVMADLIEWSKRVKSGGIVSGDDYYYFKWAGVVEAVQAYTAAYSIIPWYIFQGHKSTDFMWVKP